MTPVPAHVAIFPNGQLAVAWNDGHESYYDAHDLRCACPCASCVDEVTGMKILRDERVPRGIRIELQQTVGNYGLSIRFSDGHDTGIYTYTRLREVCPCDSCRG